MKSRPERFDSFRDPYLADPYPFLAEARAATPVFNSPDLDYWVVSFDLAPPPLQYVGREALRKSLAEWFPTFEGPIGYDVHDLNVTAGGDVAFCRSLNRLSGTRINGEETDVSVRATIGCRRVYGTWLIAHEHLSVPFYMDGSSRAAVDLTRRESHVA